MWRKLCRNRNGYNEKDREDIVLGMRHMSYGGTIYDAAAAHISDMAD